MVGIALAQVGEFSFLLAQQGQESGFLRGDPYQVFLAVSVLSMIVTRFSCSGHCNVAGRAEAWQRLRHWLPSRTTGEVVQTEGKQIRVKGDVIIVGYGLNGRNLDRVLGETRSRIWHWISTAISSVERRNTECLSIMAMGQIPMCCGT